MVLSSAAQQSFVEIKAARKFNILALKTQPTIKIHSTIELSLPALNGYVARAVGVFCVGLREQRRERLQWID